MASIDIVMIEYGASPYGRRFRDDLASMRTPFELHTFDNRGVQRNYAALSNELARRGSAPYLLFVNPDVVVAPDWDVRLVEFLAAKPHVGVVAPIPGGDAGVRSLWIDRAPELDRALRPPSREIMTALARRSASDGGHETCDESKSAFAPFFAAFMRRATWERAHGFDERLRFWGSDREFARRLRLEQGASVAITHSCIFFHEGSAAIREAKVSAEFDAKLEWVHRNRVLSRLARGEIPGWSELSVEERSSIASRPPYRRIGEPLA